MGNSAGNFYNMAYSVIPETRNFTHYRFCQGVGTFCRRFGNDLFLKNPVYAFAYLSVFLISILLFEIASSIYYAVSARMLIRSKVSVFEFKFLLRIFVLAAAIVVSPLTFISLAGDVYIFVFYDFILLFAISLGALGFFFYMMKYRIDAADRKSATLYLLLPVIILQCIVVVGGIVL